MTDLARLIAAGEAGLSPALVDELGVPWRRRDRPREIYEMDDPGLVRAATAALILGQPLILAGDPGVGKTRFAQALADRLGLPTHPTHHVKSQSAGRDVLYVFDDIARFRSKGDGALRPFVRPSPLGRAILWSAGPDAVLTPGEVPWDEIGGPALAEIAARRPVTCRDLFPAVFAGVAQPTRSVVLIDEFDKAPRDAPNDILAEIEDMAFRIDELDLRIRASDAHWPVLILTSNSERSLSDAFLRRCVFHWIEFPDADRLARIVAMHCAAAEGAPITARTPLVTGAVALFERARAACVNKKPATAELIAYVVALIESGLPLDAPPDPADARVQHMLGVLLKTRIDRVEVERQLPGWAG